MWLTLHKDVAIYSIRFDHTAKEKHQIAVGVKAN